jgi:hypothetical protein
MPVTHIARGVRRAVVGIGFAAALGSIACVAGVLPAPTRVTVDHCYVTYDQLERQHSRCVGHWTRVGRVASGPVYDVPVGTDWQVLTANPDEHFEWEVTIPESSRRHSALTVRTIAWVIPWPLPILLTTLIVLTVGLLTWTVGRLRRRTADRR